MKIALGIGDYFDESVLEEFTENKELVVKAANSSQLAKTMNEQPPVKKRGLFG